MEKKSFRNIGYHSKMPTFREHIEDHVGSIEKCWGPCWEHWPKGKSKPKRFFFNNIKMTNNFYERGTLWDIF
jgi:hypothetical protein